MHYLLGLEKEVEVAEGRVVGWKGNKERKREHNYEEGRMWGELREKGNENGRGVQQVIFIQNFISGAFHIITNLLLCNKLSYHFNYSANLQFCNNLKIKHSAK